MARPLSVASVIDKNKITSGAVWVVLLDLEVINPNTREVVETLQIVRNNEDVTFNGVVYKAANFDINIDQRQGQAPTCSVTAHDEMRFIQQRMEAMAGGVFSHVTMTIVNTERLDKDPEIQIPFEIVSSSVKDYIVTFDLGAENPLRIQFPKHTQRHDRCAWRYKGYGCGYTGAMPRCSYTHDGPEGCVAHDNVDNFRALQGLVRMNI
jgi:phage-related protein